MGPPTAIAGIFLCYSCTATAGLKIFCAFETWVAIYSAFTVELQFLHEAGIAWDRKAPAQVQTCSAGWSSPA